MTIKQHGGIFGRNPSFNRLEAEEVDVSGAETKQITIDSANNEAQLILDAPTSKQARIFFYSNGVIKWNVFRDTGGNDNLSFFGLAEALRLNRSSSDVVVPTGNLVIGTSGKGIDFSATSGTGTSELFDDYEEGTWVPIVSDGTNDATTSAAEGTYTKVGRQVTVSGSFALSSTGSTSGGIRIKGLPYTVSSGNAGRGSLNCSYAASFSLTAGHSITGSPASGGTHIFLGVWDVGGFTTDLLATELTATSTLFFSATYFTP